MGLVCWGQGCCMLQVFVGAVCELLRRLGNGRPEEWFRVYGAPKEINSDEDV